MKLYLTKLSLAIALICTFFTKAQGELVIDVTRGNLNPIPVAIPLFLSQTEEEKFLYTECRIFTPGTPLWRLAPN